MTAWLRPRLPLGISPEGRWRNLASCLMIPVPRGAVASGFSLDTPRGAKYTQRVFAPASKRLRPAMLIELSQIPPDGLDVALPEEVLDLGASAGIWTGPATVQATMHMARSGRGILISGSFNGAVPLVCSRCIEPFPFSAQDHFEVYCEAAAQGQVEEEHELTNDELDVTYLEQGRLNTDTLLRENILLSLPVQPLCHEDCRGLCPRCGANLNQSACNCTETHVDPRLQALRKLL